MKKLALSIVAASLGLTGTVQASTFVWNFDNPVGQTGSSHSYLDTTHAFSIDATGWTTQHSISKNAIVGNTWGHGNGFTYNTGDINSKDLYGKRTNGNPSETGLGLYRTSDNEITNSSFVQLDTKSLKDHGLGDVTLFISSIQKNEGFDLWGSNSAGTPGTLLKVGRDPANGGDVQSFMLPDYNQYRYFSISAASPLTGTQSDVLIRDGLTAQSVPEPMSMLALAGGVVSIIRKRRKA